MVRSSLVVLSLVLVAACSSDITSGDFGGSGGDGTGPTSGPTSGPGGSSSGGGDTGGNPSTGGVGGGGGASAGGAGPGGGPVGGAGGGAGVEDPNLDGPFATTSVSGTTGNNVPITGFAPTMPGSYPVVVIGHGFQLPTSQYANYASRVASFGYVALLPDFPTSFLGFSHVDAADDLISAIDWAASDPSVSALADTDNVGMSGHSLGGKIALLAATMDSRVKAVIALDPVDGGMNCSAQDCPDVSALMPSLMIPTGFLGETTDASGGFQPCAPAAENFTTFYAETNAPSFSLTVLGANHMSFLDNVASCGFNCSFCNMATQPNASVNAMGQAYLAAFFERYLRNDTGYDTYLTGAMAEQRYIITGQATLESK